MARTTTTTATAAATTTTTSLEQANAAAAAAQIAFFRAIPWCAAHLAARPNLVIEQALSRRLGQGPGDTLVSRTLNTPETVGAYVVFYERPRASASSPAAGGAAASNTEQARPPVEEDPALAQPQGQSPSPSPSSSPNQNPTQPQPQNQPPPGLITQVQSLIALGPQLNGWPGICHGGVVATLLDEVMGQIFALNRAHGLLAPPPVMTAYLNTRFERPVRTGPGTGPLTGTGTGRAKNGEGDDGHGEGEGVVLVTARLVRNEGRKYWVEADVRGREGEVLATGEALFIMLREKL
ncbi:uncharacterized protein THITE_2109173 [Thermothielavioides terrestris NRRL 8126]|uniref:Thioesterase domain-containing protein n=1 Tax=Thermothielavioides terrestris (strain ATCC 38088 / NRRL 8126) TaxID=578455 RepID=G2QTY1_THETT|nr:uncharacterized protein THITE_2109173 [Thermothielavioides terrestris NRRL 8126]AEO63640.1 hypothetical protein THITE_2109173 [Thermothielavioides terrestris NRRL 8126]